MISGFLSNASLYAAQPGTAPPRIFCTSRNSGLVDALVKAVVGGVVNSEAGLVATLVRVDGLTPNARTVKKDDAMMKSDESFMMRGEIVSLLDENVAAARMLQLNVAARTTKLACQQRRMTAKCQRSGATSNRHTASNVREEKGYFRYQDTTSTTGYILYIFNGTAGTGTIKY